MSEYFRYLLGTECGTQLGRFLTSVSLEIKKIVKENIKWYMNRYLSLIIIGKLSFLVTQTFVFTIYIWHKIHKYIVIFLQNAFRKGRSNVKSTMYNRIKK